MRASLINPRREVPCRYKTIKRITAQIKLPQTTFSMIISIPKTLNAVAVPLCRSIGFSRFHGSSIPILILNQFDFKSTSIDFKSTSISTFTDLP